MKYIFVAGAPGSKWSSVVKNIYFSPSVDNSDYSADRTYYHDASGNMELMHLGAYFDPGMEFGTWFDDLSSHTKAECEAEFDRPFVGSGVRIIKSHVFCNQIDLLRERWPDCPIVLVHRSDDSCLGWWVKCGEFNITYPLYHSYYKNLRTMAGIISHQNQGIADALRKYPSRTPASSFELQKTLGIQEPLGYSYQYYQIADIKVNVI